MEGMPLSSPQPAVNYRAIVERLNDLGILNDRAFAREILEEFNTDSAGVIEKLGAAIAQGDASACEQLAHRLKGASLNLGAEKLGGFALLLEQAGRGKDLTGSESVFEVLSH